MMTGRKLMTKHSAPRLSVTSLRVIPSLLTYCNALLLLAGGLDSGYGFRGHDGRGIRRSRRRTLSRGLRGGSGGIKRLPLSGLLLPKDPLEPRGLVGAAAVLLLLELGKAPSLGVHLADLLLAVRVELDNLLAGRSVGSLLEVGAQAGKEVGGALGQAVGLVGGLGAIGGVVLGVEALKRRHKAARDAVLLVELEGALDGGIADDVALGEVLGEDAGARFLLLGDLVAGTVAALVEVRALVAGVAGSAGDGDVVGTELGVVEEEGRLCGSILLKGHVGRLGLALLSDLEVGNLAARKGQCLRSRLDVAKDRAYQKLKNSLTSSSLVAVAMFLT